MKRIQTFLALAILISWGSCSFADETGDLKITFKLRGAVPEAKRFPLPAAFGGNAAGRSDERLVVDAKSKGIKDVVVYVYSGRRGTILPPQPVRKKVVRLSARNGRLDPHVVLLQVGDKLRVRNFGLVGYNLNVATFNNPPRGIVLPGNRLSDFEFEKPEPAVVPILCNIHPWIVAHALVVEHAFFSKSDEDGIVQINGLPAGGEVMFRVWHESGTFKDRIFLNGKEDQWKSNKFKLEIKPGMNDMGIVEVPVEEFDL